jgi:outer membrane protein assembly factor BamB
MLGQIIRTAAVITCLHIGQAIRADDNWPQFRGPQARGVADGKPLPSEWSAETDKNIRWKTPIPGLGHSSPVIWGDRVFVTTAVSGQSDPELKVGLYGNIKPVEDDSVHSWRVLSLDRNNGKILWEKTAHEGVPKVKRHTKATHANCTPATDGKHLIAFFASEGLYCYDFDGKLLWKKDLGTLDAGYWMVPAAQWEFASSPVIYNDMVIVQCDIQGGGFLAAFDIKDGREIWRTPRSDVPTWSTPTVHEGPERAELIVNGFRHMGGYNPRTGEELWRMSGGGDIPVPTPIVAHDLIFLTSSHMEPHPIYAIRPGASGDISLKDGQTSNEFVAWSQFRQAPYMQTPIVYGDYLYTCRDNGIMACYDAKTGERKYNMRLGTGQTGFTASAVAGDGKLYYTSEMGDVYVVRAGPEQRDPIAVNPMGEISMATPAISDGSLFFRTRGHLVRVGK